MTAYLATINGQRGPELQVLYGKAGEFVGRPPGWKPPVLVELPDEGPWSVDRALAWVLEQEKRDAAV